MGFGDVFRGMQNGPRGESDGVKGSPLMKLALVGLGIVAWRTYRGKGKLAQMLNIQPREKIADQTSARRT